MGTIRKLLFRMKEGVSAFCTPFVVAAIELIVTSVNYGYLYNWHAVSSPNFAPTDWKVPTYTELQTLSTTLGGDSVSGGKLKEIGLSHFSSPNNTLTPDSGFNFVGGGVRADYPSPGSFSNLKTYGNIWSSTAIGGGNAYQMGVRNDITSTSYNGFNAYYYGQSVRLLYTGAGAPTTVTDYDGNIYSVVLIGTQYWIAQNWRCTHFNNGVPLTKVTNNATWASLTTEGYCAYNNDEANVI